MVVRWQPYLSFFSGTAIIMEGFQIARFVLGQREALSTTDLPMPLPLPHSQLVTRIIL